MSTVLEHVDPDRTRRAETSSRFVAFTFAASEMVIEADVTGTITYAAGAFRSRFGLAPETFIGRPLSDLVAPCDQDALFTAILLLHERGRLQPCIVRLANAAQNEAVLAGLQLTPGQPGSAICLTLGLPPVMAGQMSHATTAQQLLQTIGPRLSGPCPGHLALVEVSGSGLGRDRLDTALEAVSPRLVASEVAPGRYGVLGESQAELSSLLPALEAAFRRQGDPGRISSRQIALDCQELSPVQASRALRQALTVFARGGMDGIAGAGFGDGLAAYVQGAMVQAGAVRKAIAQRLFTMQYQPIVHLHDRTLHHYEALLRPSHGMAGHTPQEFVTLVETVGLADELDMAVTAMVCEAADQSGTSIALNLSGQSVQDPAFRDRMLSLLQSSRAVRDGRILVEMTETAQVNLPEEAAETSRRLRAMGIRFCMDDFGAGAADIRLLRAIPTDIVKLDGSFVPGVLNGGRERAFVVGMVEIARAAGAKVVAERVETEAEAEALAGIGADFGQGWLFGRPGPLPAPRPTAPAKRRKVLDESWS